MIYPIIFSLQNETIKPNTRDIPIISVPVPTTFRKRQIEPILKDPI